MKKILTLAMSALLLLTACNNKAKQDESISEESKTEEEILTPEEVANLILQGSYRLQSRVSYYDDGAEEKDIIGGMIIKDETKYAFYDLVETDEGQQYEINHIYVSDESKDVATRYSLGNSWYYEVSDLEEFMQDLNEVGEIINIIKTMMKQSSEFTWSVEGLTYKGHYEKDEETTDIDIVIKDEVIDNIAYKYVDEDNFHIDVDLTFDRFNDVEVELPVTTNEVADGLNYTAGKLLEAGSFTISMTADVDINGTHHVETFSYKFMYKENGTGYFIKGEDEVYYDIKYVYCDEESLDIHKIYLSNEEWVIQEITYSGLMNETSGAFSAYTSLFGASAEEYAYLFYDLSKVDNDFNLKMKLDNDGFGDCSVTFNEEDVLENISIAAIVEGYAAIESVSYLDLGTSSFELPNVF